MRDPLHLLSDPASRGRRSPGILIKAWLFYGAWCACAGWTLSALHQLNATAYAIAGVIPAVIVVLLIWKRHPRLGMPRLRLFRRLREFRRPLPAVYLLLLSGSLTG
jgi:hypothetical protein